ncbi:MAG: ParB/RepB/Spo0J family partition protein [Phycisphaerae bacterium]
MAKKQARSPQKKRLGRGLSSLIGTPEAQPAAKQSLATSDKPADSAAKPPAQASGEPTHLPVHDITANPYQPRREFDDEQLRELADSIAQQGIIQPLVVTPANGHKTKKPYVLIAGERRLRAAKRAGLKEVPCVVRQADRRQMVEWALVENIQRTDLNAIERAHAYREYIDRFELTQAEAAQRLGQPRATVANYLRMLDLAEDVQSMLIEGKLSFGHAKVLAAVTDPAQQVALAHKILKTRMTVRQLEKAVDAMKRGADVEAGTTAVRTKPTYILDLEEQLTQTIGTKVNIKPGRAKHTGRLMIDYYSLDDFDRIASLLGLRLED